MCQECVVRHVAERRCVINGLLDGMRTGVSIRVIWEHLIRNGTYGILGCPYNSKSDPCADISDTVEARVYKPCRALICLK